MLLTVWLDKVFDERKNVEKEFGKLQFYIDKFKPIAEIEVKHREKMVRFLTQAYECHLNIPKSKVINFISKSFSIPLNRRIKLKNDFSSS